MHREIGAAVFERGFELLDEQALAANFAQGAVQDLVALGGHAQQFHLPAQARLEQGLDMLGLPQRQAALAGGDNDFFHGGGTCRHT